MSHPLFTIAIPAFKSSYLGECIESVLNQSYKDFELLIIDDCSPEDLKSIVLKYEDARIRYYRNEKGFGAVNVVGNWNKCLEYANGEFIICIGDDDKLKPCCLEEYKRLIDRYPEKNVFHGWTEIIDEKSNFLEITSIRPETESVYSMIWHRWEGRQQFIGDFCFKRAKLITNGGFYYLPLAWGSDDITSVIAATPNGVANTRQLVFQYRKNRFSISTGKEVNIRDKVQALCLEETWFANYLTGEPEDEIDKLFKMSLVNKLSNHYKKRKIGYITNDISKKVMSITYWLRNNKVYDLDKRDLIKPLIVGIWNFLRK